MDFLTLVVSRKKKGKMAKKVSNVDTLGIWFSSRFDSSCFHSPISVTELN